LKFGYGELMYVIAGLVFYSIAIITTFGRALWERSILGPTLGPIFMIASATLGGLGVVVIGYVMILILAGSASLSLAKFIAHLTRSKQIVERSKTSTKSGNNTNILERAHWLYLPGVVFICALGLGWDVHNADGPGAGRLQPLLHALDIFSRPSPGVGPILFSRQLIPALIVLTSLAGIVPAIALPYIEKFKVTGINAGPFHTTLLLYAVGALAGLGAILTLLGLVYRSLWLNRTPLPYHFGILAILGFSMHFSLGMRLGMEKAELRILKQIHQSESGRLKILK
jgi:hypothetical protein